MYNLKKNVIAELLIIIVYYPNTKELELVKIISLRRK